MWKFSEVKDIRTTPISCIYAIGMFYANVLLYTGVGHCIVYFCLGFVRTSYLINGNSTPHFLFYINRTFGVGGQTKTYYEKVIFSISSMRMYDRLRDG